MRIDANCLVGAWPFYKTRESTFDDLKRIHAQNGMDGAYVSSIEAIFYNDPYEAEEELQIELVKETNYKHVLTVNPMLSAWEERLCQALENMQIDGIKIVPGYHGYSLNSQEALRVKEIAERFHLPLFISMHLIDERTMYLFSPSIICTEELDFFLKRVEGMTILCNIRVNEILSVLDIIRENPCILFDTSGLKDKMFVLEKLYHLGIENHIVFGSQAPLLCFSSSKMLVETENIPDYVKNNILHGIGI